MHTIQNGETGHQLHYATKEEAMAAIHRMNRYDMHEPWYYCH